MLANYKQIFKATSIYGGVQVVTIVINLIKSKCIAVFLGPAGMGINGLINSTITLISTLTNLGLSSSAVKNVAAAFGTGDIRKVAVEIGVLRKLVWVTGCIGSIVVLVLSPALSIWAIGNKDLQWAFYIVAF
ncbi:oligosaccharide flippase family protein, partial [Flavihumibacter sp. CACIAM 22H1]|uniref:oligosaccharide flippase family protein n=1 Tax=Flavihumibacter sp. CACIAM 22H1 TaxID=1812911 RepID=UPI0025BF0A54